MPSVEQLLAQLAQLHQTILLQAQTIATLTEMLAGDDQTGASAESEYLNG